MVVSSVIFLKSDGIGGARCSRHVCDDVAAQEWSGLWLLGIAYSYKMRRVPINNHAIALSACLHQEVEITFHHCEWWKVSPTFGKSGLLRLYISFRPMQKKRSTSISVERKSLKLHLKSALSLLLCFPLHLPSRLEGDIFSENELGATQWLKPNKRWVTTLRGLDHCK